MNPGWPILSRYFAKGWAFSNFLGPQSFPPHHVTSKLVAATLISDDDRRRDGLLQSKSSRSKSFVSRILISKFFDIRILRGISC